MALSEKWVLEKARELLWNPRYTGFNPVAFARAIETEVRKDDTELIRQLVEAMEGVKALNMGGELALWTAEFDRLLSAITAARARLEQPCA